MKRTLAQMQASQDKAIFNAARKAKESGSLPEVTGNAIIVNENGELAGQPVPRVVRLWEKLPGWWNCGSDDQKTLWLRGFFRDQLGLKSDQQLVSVVVEIGR